MHEDASLIKKPRKLSHTCTILVVILFSSIIIQMTILCYKYIKNSRAYSHKISTFLIARDSADLYTKTLSRLIDMETRNLERLKLKHLKIQANSGSKSTIVVDGKFARDQIRDSEQRINELIKEQNLSIEDSEYYATRIDKYRRALQNPIRDVDPDSPTR